MLPSKTPKLHPGVIWETEGPHASTSNVSTSMCASNATAGIQMVIALSQAMPRKRKGPKILVGYKHKKGTGHSKWEGCHEIVDGKSSGRWAPSTQQYDIVEVQKCSKGADSNANRNTSPPCNDTTCTISTTATAENATPPSSATDRNNNNNTDTMLLFSLNNGIRIISSTIVTPASISSYMHKKIQSATCKATARGMDRSKENEGSG